MSINRDLARFESRCDDSCGIVCWCYHCQIWSHHLQCPEKEIWTLSMTLQDVFPNFGCLFHVINVLFISFFVTLRSSLVACFLAFLSSLLSSLLRGWVDTRGRSESLILDMRSACLAVRPLLGRTSRGIPVLLDTRICFGWGQKQEKKRVDSCLRVAGFNYQVSCRILWLCLDVQRLDFLD